MPIYEYACTQCGHAFEALVRSGTTPQCPQCQSVALDKLLSVFTASCPDTSSASRAREAAAAGPCAGCGNAAGPGACGLR